MFFLKSNTYKFFLKNTIWLTIGDICRISINLFSLILLARYFGPKVFGAYAAILAMLNIFFPFSDIGANSVLLMNISRKKQYFSEYFGNAIIKIALMGGLLILFTVLIGTKILFDNSFWKIILCLAIAELYFNKFIELFKQILQSYELLKLVSVMNIILSTIRLVFILVFIFSNSSDLLELWSLFYLLSSFISFLVACSIIVIKVGYPNFHVAKIVFKIKEGFFFSLAVFSKTIYTDIDKTMLTKMISFEANGIYSVAYKIILVFLIPIRALLDSTIANFFQKGESGLNQSWNFAKTLMPISILYGIFVGVIIYLSAPMVLMLFGQEYKCSIEALKWLCFLPLFQSIHYLMANTLTSSNFQGFRSFAQGSIALINIMLNLLLIPLYSWKGAIWATLFSELFLIFIFLFIIRKNLVKNVIK